MPRPIRFRERRRPTAAATLALALALPATADLPPTPRPFLAQPATDIPSLDPATAGWPSETLHQHTSAQLDKLAAAIAAQANPSHLLHPDATARAPLVPTSSPIHYTSGHLTVRRPRQDTPPDTSPQPLATALATLASYLQTGATPPTIHFKQFAITPPEDSSESFTTTAYLTAATATASLKATWHLVWKRSSNTATTHLTPPLLDAVTPSECEQVTADTGGDDTTPTILAERTTDHLAQLDTVTAITATGANSLTTLTVSESGRHLIGIAVGDANNDGFDDVFSPQPEGLPNLYLLSQPDGSLTDAATTAGLDWLDPTRSALFADFDNDGDQDLAVATARLVILLSNDGDGTRFTRRATFPQPDTTSLAAADFDRDGLLDLFVANYLAAVQSPTTTVADPTSVYDANNGGANQLLHNRGGFSFTDATATTGLDHDATRLTFAAAWEDFDDDGDPDLYLANDFGPNALYRNDAGSFTDVAAPLGADDPSTGMTASWGDTDRDGDIDLFVGNMFSAAGNRITFQPRFARALDTGSDVDRVRYLARGNTLLINGGGTTGFTDRSKTSGAHNTQWTWSTLLADLDNSGHPDLIALNGFLTGPRPDDL